MNIISMKRGQGKTIFLIKTSCFSNTPIVCANKKSKMIIEDMAKDMKMNIPEPIIVEDFLEDRLRGKRINSILIDDLEDILSIIFKTNIGSVTTSCEIYNWK